MARVYVSAELPGDAATRLSAAHDVTVGRLGDDADAWVSLLTDRIDEARLAKAPRLRIVANVAVGVDNIDLAACARRGVVVSNTPDVLTEATADLAFGLLLAAARRICEGDRLVRAGGWKGWTPTFMVGGAVHGATLGIVGLGRIGQAMGRRARGFGMRVLYTQRSRADAEVERELDAAYVTLDELLARSDAVSIHCPLTAETRGAFSRERLAQMKPGSVLLNTARGPIVDEAALADALASGRLGAAGLDVYEAEPEVHPALLALENVVLTPHIASAERATRAKMAGLAAENVLSVLAGKPALTPVWG